MQYIFPTDCQVMIHWMCFGEEVSQVNFPRFPDNFEFLLVHLIAEPVIAHVNCFYPFDLQSVLSDAHSAFIVAKISVSNCGYPRSMAVWPTWNSFGAALFAQSPKNKIPPVLERALDSLRYEASLWQTGFMLLARICIVAFGHLEAYWKKRSIFLLINDEGLACFEAILLMAVYIVGSTARAQKRKTQIFFAVLASPRRLKM